MGTVNDQAKYFKVAEVGNIDGYTRERIEGSSDANLSAFEFIPEDEAAPIDTIYMTGSFGTPDSTIDNDMLYYSMSGHHGRRACHAGSGWPQRRVFCLHG